jgi:hypothetical protein
VRAFADSDWFAGFADGEGSFTFCHGRRKPRVTTGHNPVFSLVLRADDLAILESLKAEFGGTIYVTHPPSVRKAHPGGNPRATWNVVAKADLARLVRYFDAHPLHAKKARDYAIWRRGVLAYQRGGRSDPELPALSEALVATRMYDGEEIEIPESPQLRLVS